MLIVEDDAKVADLLERVLASQGIGATVAQDGPSGREAWASGGHDLVLLDVMLPGIDGISLLRERRDAGDETPVFLLTARDEPEAVERGRDAGATEHVAKPFSFPDLVERVKARLAG